MNVLEEVKNEISGLDALTDWLGDEGRAVHPLISEARGKICVTGNQGEPCPRNCEPNWWDRVKSKIADWIKRELEIKHTMKLETAWDPELHMCGVCGCCLQLKVHTPSKYIHLTKDQNAKTPAYCWMRLEKESIVKA